MKNQHNAKRKALATLLVSSRQAVIALTLAIVFTATMFVPGAQAFAESKKKLLASKTISVMGDSISTYTGWSDKYPITDPSCTNRYGEAYYGPVGGDFHNTELLVTDTWWHQAATELGAEILMSNAGNSTGLFCASYPANAAWDLYLKEMLAYKSRPHYLGRDGRSPDIIALYIGSNELARAKPSEYGSVSAIDFASLITNNGDGTFTYDPPTTVAEAYCILMEKVTALYPNAEIYCFAVVPSAGGYLSTVNERLANTPAFNKMVREVADHYGATVVDLVEAFGLDPDNNGVATQEDCEFFQSCFNDDPHPNAKGFDIITEAFVSAVLENSEYFASVETKGGLYEAVPVTTASSTADGITTINQSAKKYTTPNGYRVDFSGIETVVDDQVTYAHSTYTSQIPGKYKADGGREFTVKAGIPEIEVSIPLKLTGDSSSDPDNNTNSSGKDPGRTVTGDEKTSPDDGIYDYRILESRGGKVSVRTNNVSISEPTVTEGATAMQYVHSVAVPSEINELLTDVSKLDRPTAPDEVPTIADGYDVIFLGSDQYSRYYTARAEEKTTGKNAYPFYKDDSLALYQNQANYSVFYDYIPRLMVPRMYLDADTTVKFSEYKATPPADADKYTPNYNNWTGFPARWESVQHFTLSDKNANIATTYCAELGTATIEGFCYNMVNIADVDRYTEADARMIRTVAYNGYWGTSEGFGSLDELKNNLLESGKFTDDELEGLTDGIAMTATQYAIWHFSNKADDIRFINSYLADKDGLTGELPDEDKTDLLFKVYFHLIGLDPTDYSDDKNTENTLINSENFLKDVSLTIKGRPTDLEENQDADTANDKFNADITFEFEVAPQNAEGECLVMTVLENGSVLATGRISGEPQPGETCLTHVPGTNKYILSNVVLQEGSHENIRFQLSGRQNLIKDAYLYVSENRISENGNGITSQTFVGIAEGSHDVNVVMDLSFNLDVEAGTYTEERIWRTEKYTGNTPKPKPTPTPPPPPFNIPKTGDMPFWAAIAEFLGF